MAQKIKAATVTAATWALPRVRFYVEVSWRDTHQDQRDAGAGRGRENCTDGRQTGIGHGLGGHGLNLTGPCTPNSRSITTWRNAIAQWLQTWAPSQNAWVRILSLLLSNGVCLPKVRSRVPHLLRRYDCHLDEISSHRNSA